MTPSERKAVLLTAATAIEEIEHDAGSDQLYDTLGITASTITDALRKLAEDEC